MQTCIPPHTTSLYKKLLLLVLGLLQSDVARACWTPVARGHEDGGEKDYQSRNANPPPGRPLLPVQLVLHDKPEHKDER